MVNVEGTPFSKFGQDENQSIGSSVVTHSKSRHLVVMNNLKKRVIPLEMNKAISFDLIRKKCGTGDFICSTFQNMMYSATNILRVIFKEFMR